MKFLLVQSAFFVLVSKNESDKLYIYIYGCVFSNECVCGRAVKFILCSGVDAVVCGESWRDREAS